MPFRLLLLLTGILVSLQLISQNLYLQEDFNSGTLPMGWTNQAIIGTQNWSFGNNASQSTSGNNNLNGSNLAYFDDDALGAGSTNNTAALITDTFDNSSFAITYLEFDYNFQEFPRISDSFYVDVYDGSVWNRVFSRVTNDCGAWTAPACLGNYPHAKINISAYANANCLVRFFYHDGNDWGWGIGIDNVEIYSPYPNDVAVDSILNFPSSCNANDSLKVIVRNLGTQSAFGFDLKYSINNGAAVTASFNDTIAAQSSSSITFPNLINLSPGSNNIKAYTDWSSDQDRTNDSAQTFINLSNPFNLPYVEDFESSLSNWSISGSNPSWQIGSPSGNIINRAAAGQVAAVTNLSGNYNANEISYLESPCIQLAAADSILRLSFDLIYFTETVHDKFWVETSIDDGLSWNKVLDNSNYAPTNWYSNSLVNYWSGIDTLWRRSSLVIEGLPTNSSVKFRFVFQSDASGNFEGVGIDNFSLDRLKDIDLSLKSILSPNSNTPCGFNQAAVKIELENYGKLAVDSGLLYYQVNAGTIYSDSLNFSIPTGAIRSFTFDSSYNFFNFSSFNLKCWIKIRGDSMPLNDTIQKTIQNYNPSQINQVPFIEGFDSFNPAGPLINGWTKSPQATTTCYSWTVSNGSTGSVNTGPRNLSSIFFFLETSCGSSSDPMPSLISPCLEIANVSRPLLLFDYHKYGVTMGPLFVDVFDGIKWTQIDSIGGQTQNSTFAPWKIRGLDLINYRNYRIKIRFRGRKTTSFTSDMAIDNVSIFDGRNDSIKFSDLKIDSAYCQGSGQSVISFKFNKYFNSSLERDSLYFELFLNGNLVANERYPQGLSAYTFDSAFTFSSRPQIRQAGINQIKVRMNFIRNGQLIQDSLEKVITTKIDQLPYFQGFEGLFNGCFDGAFVNDPSVSFIRDEGWSIGPSRNIGWHVSDSSFCKYSGFNNTSLTYSILTGPKTTIDSSAFVYWERNVDTSTTTNLIYLYTPCFNLSNYSQARLEYWYHRYREFGQLTSMGSLALEVENNGQWVRIDRIDTMFFNVPSQKWLRSSIDITPYLDSCVQFRYSVSGSNPFYHTAIDAFKIYDPLTTSIEESRPHPHTLTVYPNPNNGEFSIEVPSEMVGKRYELVDMSGKVIESSTFRSTSQNIQIEADKGFYILRVPEYGIHQKVVVY